jgi:hypothetical protein
MRVGAFRIVGTAFLVSCLATSAFAADRAIQNGIDVWRTTDDGSTFVDFAKTPIPAGFFCPGSAAFTGRVAFQGEPVVTGTPGALGAADTIVQRLDDAVFNKRGVAVTRIQFRALSLKSLAPIETACGKFTATARLNGAQPTTQMVITRDGEKGGRFSAPLALNVMVSFKPVGQVGGEALEIPVAVRFPAMPNLPWRSKAAAPVPAGFVLVDTDGDRVADTYLPGTSNFIAGQSSRAGRGATGAIEKLGSQGQYICHAGDDPTGVKQHCFWLCDGCQIP